jgi:hypothetical protein
MIGMWLPGGNQVSGVLQVAVGDRSVDDRVVTTVVTELVARLLCDEMDVHRVAGHAVDREGVMDGVREALLEIVILT